MMKSVLGALALSSALLALPASAAIEFDFTGGNLGANGQYDGTYSATVGGLTVSVFAGIYGSNAGPDFIVDANCADGGCGAFDRVVQKTASGLGIDDPAGFPDTDGPDVDGSVGNDLITFVFNKVVKFSSALFSQVDGNDDFDIFVDGALVAEDVGIAGNNPYDLSSFIPSSGTSISFGADGTFDNFRVASITVSPVPLPAASLLLLTALGGAAMAYRRRRA